MEEEQNGLELVFKGVTVEMLLQEPDDYESYGVVPTQGQWDIVRERSRQLPRTLSILVTVPDLDSMEIKLKLKLGEGLEKEDILFQENYIKTKGSDTLTTRQENNPNIEKDDRATTSKHNGIHTISIKDHLHSNHPPKLLSLYVSFLDSDNADTANFGTFTMRI